MEWLIWNFFGYLLSNRFFFNKLNLLKPVYNRNLGEN